MNLRSIILKSLPNQQKYNDGCRLMPIVFTFGTWRNLLSCALLWLVAIIATNLLIYNSAHAQSQLRDINVTWDDGHGTINSTSGGTYTNQTGEVVIPMGDHLDAEAFEYLGSRRLKSSFLQPPDTMRTGFKLGDQNSFVTLTYGYWQVQNYAACTEEENQGKLCGVITFVPNVAAINSLIGQTIRSELHLLQIDIVPPNLHYRRTPPAVLTATIHGQSQVTLSWKNNATGEIPRIEGAMEYENLEGTLFTYDSSDNYQILSSVSESKNGDTPPKMDDSAGSAQTIDGFDGFEGKPLGETNFEYGTWYIAPNNQGFLFNPDFDAIQALDPGDIVESILTIKITPSSTTSTTLAMNTITVEISRKIESELSWTSGKLVEVVTAVSGATSYSDVTGRIEIENRPPPENFTVSAMVTETQIGNAADIMNGSLVASSTRPGYKIIGSTSTFSYGNWFINNDNNEFVFAPKATAISALTVGQEITITLEFKIEATVRGSTTNKVENTQEIMLKISPPLPTISMEWGSSSRGKGTSHAPNVIEITLDESDDYPLLTGTGIISNFKTGLSISQNPKEQLNDGAVNDEFDADFALVEEIMDTDQTKYGLVRNHVTVVDDEITVNNNYGIWYYLAPVREVPMSKEAIFEFEYKPNAKLINALQRGEEFTTWIDLLVCSANCLTRDVNDEDNDGSTADSVEVPGVVLARGQATVIIYGLGDPSLELSWDNEFSGKIRKRVGTDTNYQDRRGVVETFKISPQDQIKATITEEKTDARTITETSGSENSDLGFDATLYQGDLVYGSWYFARDKKKFVFKPNDDTISQLRPGETVTSTMSVNIVNPSGGNVIESPVTITYTIEAPSVELKWDEDTNGLIRKRENASNYDNLSGIVDSKFLPNEPYYRISITESDSSVPFTAEVTNSDLGFEARRFFGNDLQYGSWYFATDNSKFVFQPNAIAVNELESDETVTSTISVEPIDSRSGEEFLSEAISITVYIAAANAVVVINPVISIFPASPTATAGDTITFTIESDQNLFQPLEVGITYPDSENQIMWRIPRIVMLDARNRSRDFQIQTVKRYTATETEVDFKVAIANSQNYQISETKGRVTMQISPTGGHLTSNLDSRVSVANVAVESILETLINSNSPIRGSGSSIIPRFSIFSELTEIQEGQNVVYRIVSDVQVSSPILIYLEFDQIGNVIESPSHQVIFPANESSINFEVPTVDDNKAESDVILGIRIISGTEYRLGVNNSASILISDSKDRERKRRGYLDGVNQSIMLAIMNQSGTNTFNVVSERTNHALIQRAGSKFEFGQNDGFAELFSTSNEILIENEPLRSSLVGQSSFSIELFPDLSTSNLAEIWGFGNYQTVQKTRGEIGPAWDGDMYLANIGTDTRVYQNMLAGFAYSYSDSIIEFDSYDGHSVSHTSEFHGITPYLSWKSTAFQSNLHVISSIKQGRIEIEHDGYETISLDNTMYVFGLGGNKNLSSIATFYSSNPITFELEGDAWLVQLHPTSVVEDFTNTKLESNQFNLALEANQRFTLGDNITVFPSLSFGYHRNQENLQSDSGYEIESAIEFADNDSYKIASKGRIIQNQQNSTQNWALNSEFDYDKYFDNLGVKIQVEHSLVQSQNTTIGSNLSHNLINYNNTFSNNVDENEFNFKFGYGISVLDYSSILTPISNLRIVDNQFDRLQIGSRISLGQDLEFGLIASYFDNSKGTTSQQLKLTGRINW